MAEIHKKGVHVTPYINGRLWDPQADSFDRDGGAEATARKQDGTLYTELYGTSGTPNANVCPYTEIWHDKQVPEVLLSGHHANIQKWRHEQALLTTLKKRPELLEKVELTPADLAIIHKNDGE